MKRHRCVSVVALVVLALTAGAARAEISIDFVTVGNPGNAGEQSRLHDGDNNFYGGVTTESASVLGE